VYNLPGLKLYDKENIKGQKAESGYGTEIAGKQGLPMGTEEAFPRKIRQQIPCLPKPVDDTVNSFMGDGNRKFE
jgi:hypothetical protein